MRDLFFLAALPFLLFAITQRPFIGLGLWLWTALFYPNAWLYGIAGSIRYNLLFAGLTILVYLLSKNKTRLQLGTVGVLVILFFIWTFFSTMFGLALPEVAWDYWVRLAKIVTLFVFILLIIEKRLHIDFFLWCLVLSIGFFAGLEGLKYIASGGGHRIEGFAGHVLGDRNELAVALAMLLPICFYLMREYGAKSKIIRLGFLGLITLIVVSIVGSGSRGGLVSLAAVGAYLFIKSKRKLLFAVLALVIGATLVGLISDEWFNRMDTIATADQDSSFMGRVVAWKMSFILAMKHPLLGGGFKALEYFPVWSSLSTDFDKYPFFFSGDALPDLYRGRAAHSIYFQVLGDQGIVGFFLFIAILGLSFVNAGGIAEKCRNANGPVWLLNLATMLRLSIFTYAVGGAALSFAYFDMSFALFAIVIVLEQKFLPSLLKPTAAP